MSKIFVVQFKNKNSKNWLNKAAHFVYKNALFEVRQLKAETKETRHAPTYRVVEFIEKK